MALQTQRCSASPQHTSREWFALYLWLMDADLMACIKYVTPHCNLKQEQIGIILSVSGLIHFVKICSVNKPHFRLADQILLPYGRPDFANLTSAWQKVGYCKRGPSHLRWQMSLKGHRGIEGTEHFLGWSDPKCKAWGMSSWIGDEIKSLVVLSSTWHFLAVWGTNSCSIMHL